MLAQFEDNVVNVIAINQHQPADLVHYKEMWQMAADLLVNVSDDPYLKRPRLPEQFQQIAPVNAAAAIPAAKPMMRPDPYPHRAPSPADGKIIELINVKDAMKGANLHIGNGGMIQFRFKTPAEAAVFLKAAQRYFGDTDSIIEHKDSPGIIRLNEQQYKDLHQKLGLPAANQLDPPPTLTKPIGPKQ